MKDFKVYQTSGMLNFLVSEAADVRKKEQTVSGDSIEVNADSVSPVKIVVDFSYSNEVSSIYIHQINNNNLMGGDAWFETGSGTIDLENRTISGSSSSTLPQLGARQVRPRYKENTRYTLIIDWETTATNGRPGFVWSYTDGTSDNMYADIPANTRSRSVIVSRANKTLTGISRTSYSGNKTFYVDGCGLFEGVITEDDFVQYSGTIIGINWSDVAGTVQTGTLTINYDGSVTLETGGQTYTLTSVSPIETVIGDNIFWADNGNISVTYPI